MERWMTEPDILKKEFIQLSNTIKINPITKYYSNIELIPEELVLYTTKNKDSMSNFEKILYEDTINEIFRVEKDLNNLKQFLSIIDPKKEISNSRVKKKKPKTKITKSGKKIGRPTNAEKEAREYEENTRALEKFERELSRGT